MKGDEGEQPQDAEDGSGSTEEVRALQSQAERASTDGSSQQAPCRLVKPALPCPLPPSAS